MNFNPNLNNLNQVRSRLESELFLKQRKFLEEVKKRFLFHNFDGIEEKILSKFPVYIYFKHSLNMGLHLPKPYSESLTWDGSEIFYMVYPIEELEKTRLILAYFKDDLSIFVKKYLDKINYLAKEKLKNKKIESVKLIFEADKDYWVLPIFQLFLDCFYLKGLHNKNLWDEIRKFFIC